MTTDLENKIAGRLMSVMNNPHFTMHDIRDAMLNLFKETEAQWREEMAGKILERKRIPNYPRVTHTGRIRLAFRVYEAVNDELDELATLLRSTKDEPETK